MSDESYREQILTRLVASPRLCHAVLFAHRHPQKTPPFHNEIIDLWWSDDPAVMIEAFRGGAKSTLSEEAVCAQALLKFFKYALIIGNSYDRAVERLNSIKHELETNDHIIEIFGEQQGGTWNEGEIILKNGVKIQAFGARQSLRGAKHWDQRPDVLFVDDLEDEENAGTKEARAKLSRWFFGSVIPACEPLAKKRVVGTPLNPESLLEILRKASGWTCRVYPIVSPAVSDYERWDVANWPARFPLDAVRSTRDDMEKVGELGIFVQEYLCQSEEAALKPFQTRHVVPAPQIPEWAPVIVICDPARSVNIRTSARTGYIAVSWFGAKLYVRAAYGAFHRPDEIVAELFKLDQTFSPIQVAVEEDGLAEFLMQPLRSHMLSTGQVIPLKALRAPRERSKAQFIMGLQPFFEAQDILMCGDFPDLKTELLAFPTGRNDVINALAYAPRLRAGKAVYEDFGLSHVAPDLRVQTLQPAYLCVSARASHTTAVLAQFLNGCVRVFADWVKEGSPTEALEVILPEATIAAAKKLTLVAPLAQFNAYTNAGLPTALRRLNITATKGPDHGLGSLQPFLRRQTAHQPAFLVDRRARWTINALAGGYSRSLDRSGILTDDPDEGYYRTLMEGLESFGKWLTAQTAALETDGAAYAYTRDGRRYMTSGRGSDGGAQQLKR